MTNKTEKCYFLTSQIQPSGILTKHVLLVDVVLHLEAGIFHREIDCQFFDFHVRDAVAIDRFAVHLGNGADIGCERINDGTEMLDHA